MVIIYGEGGGSGKWERGGGGKRTFTLINRGVKKVLTQRKGGVKNVFELKYHVYNPSQKLLRLAYIS